MNTLVFDIETVPDVELLSREFGFSGSACEVYKEAEAHFLKTRGQSFLPHIYHKVVSIAWVAADEFGAFIKVGNFGKSCPKQYGDALEQMLIAQFLDMLAKTPLLVSYNGRGFDLPVLMLRAMKYNLNAHAFYEENNFEANKSKWENYKQRFSEKFHIDLLDSLSMFSPARSSRLDSICALLGLPGKYDMSGSEVASLYYYTGKSDKDIVENATLKRGEQVFTSFVLKDGIPTFKANKGLSKALETIDTYCQSDVLNTYLVFLKYMILRGDITTRDYANILCGMEDTLPGDKSYSEVFLKAIKKEISLVTKSDA